MLAEVALFASLLPLVPAPHALVPRRVAPDPNELSVLGNWIWADIREGRGQPWDVTLDGVEGDILLQPTEGGVFVISENLSFVSRDGTAEYIGAGSIFFEQRRFDPGFRCAPKSATLVGERLFVHYLLNVGHERSSIAQYDARTGRLTQRYGVNILSYQADERILPLGDGVMFVPLDSTDGAPLRYFAVGDEEPGILQPTRAAALLGRWSDKSVSFGGNVLRIGADGSVDHFPFSQTTLGPPSSAHVLPSGRVLARYFFPVDPGRLPRSTPGTNALSLYEGEVSAWGKPYHRWTFQSPRFDFGLRVDSVERFFGAANGVLWGQTPQGIVAFDETGAVRLRVGGAQGIACTPKGLLARASGSLRLFTLTSDEAVLPDLPEDILAAGIGTHGVYFARRKEGSSALILSFRPYESQERCSIHLTRREPNAPLATRQPSLMTFTILS